MTPLDGRGCGACGKPLAGRREDAKYCSGACRAEASRRRNAEGALRPNVRFPGPSEGQPSTPALEHASEARRAPGAVPPADVPDPLVAVVDAIFSLYEGDAMRAVDAIGSAGAAESWLRAVTACHLQRRGWAAGRADADAIIAEFRELIAEADRPAERASGGKETARQLNPVVFGSEGRLRNGA